MNRTTARWLIKLYPRTWQARYGAEFAAFLAEDGGGVGTLLNVAANAIREQFFTTAGGDMRDNNSRLRSFSRHAPWATFTLAPLILLAAAYVAALTILWSGWQMFLPQSQTPFVRTQGFPEAYFAVGRGFYYCSPVLIGWYTAWLAARWKIAAKWPVAAFALLAITSVAVKVSASLGRVGKNVGIGFEFSSFSRGDGLLIAIFVFAAMAVPYWLLRPRSLGQRESTAGRRPNAN